jgi:hypothetical protein
MFLISFFGKVLMESAINTPKHRKEQGKVVPLFWGKELFLADEERSGGVAVIELPP